MNIRQLNARIKVFTISAAFLFLTGCKLPWPFSSSSSEKSSSSQELPQKPSKASGNENSSSPKIVEFKDGSVITLDTVNSEVALALASDPFMSKIDPAQIPLAMKEQLFNQVLQVKLLELNADEKGVESDPEFKKEIAQTYQKLVQMTKAKWFYNKVRDNIKNTVADKEVKKRYEQEKSRLVKTPGGIKTAGIKFNSYDDAKAFNETLDAASTMTIKDFKEASKAALNGTFRDFGRISEDAPLGANKALVDAAISSKTFPSVELVKVGDDEFWVTMFEDKKETIYLTLDEMKSRIREVLENEKMGEQVEAEIKNLQSKYVKNIDLSIFKTDAKAMPEDMENFLNSAAANNAEAMDTE